MTVIFFSDLHGSPESLEKLSRWLEKYRPHQLVLLGDVMYHGPRNSLCDDYAPQRVATLLNGWKDKIIAVRGNCDCEVDQMLLEFPIMADYSTLLLDNRKFFLSHGHYWHPGHLPPLGCADVLAFGHTHIPQITREEGIFCFNPGSLSLPKGGFPPSFGLYQDNQLSVLNLQTGDTLFTQSLLEL